MIPVHELAPATLLAYKSDLKAFQQWAIEAGYSPEITTATLLAFMDANRRTWSAATLVRRLFALAALAQHDGLPNPVDARVISLIGSIHRHSMPSSPATPLLLHDLVAVLAVIPATRIGYRDKALLCIGWWGALRRSEIVALLAGDVVIEERGLVVTIRRSKTCKRARKIALPKQQPASVCPVIQLINWQRRAAIRGEGPLFLAFRGRGMTKLPLTGRAVGRVLQRWAAVAGLDKRFSAHSLRSGYITEACMAGVPLHAIQQVSRHASARGVERYIHPGMWEHNPSTGLGQKIIGGNHDG